MEEKEWAKKIRETDADEFALYPRAFTPFAEEPALTLPPLEFEYSGDEGQKDSGDAQSNMPSWVKNISFTIGGLTIGGAAVYGLLGGVPPAPVCPSPAVAQTQSSTSVPASPQSAATAPATQTGGTLSGGGRPPASTTPPVQVASSTQQGSPSSDGTN